MNIPGIAYNADGLVPCIVQDADTLEVLMMAWMSEESLALTLERGETVFWSRSRRELWHKGATSGNVQKLVTGKRARPASLGFPLKPRASMPLPGCLAKKPSSTRPLRILGIRAHAMSASSASMSTISNCSTICTDLIAATSF